MKETLKFRARRWLASLVTFMMLFNCLPTTILAEGAADLPEVIENTADRYEPFPLTDIQRAYWSNMRQLEQDLKEQTIEYEKVKELYFGKRKTISGNILTKDSIQAEKNNELADALPIDSVPDILSKYNILCEDL